MQWNAQGLTTKLTEFKKIIFERKPDIICIQETFLKPKHLFHLPGYNIIRKDRIDNRKGGVAILTKQGINYRLIDTPPELECVSVEITSKNESITIVSIYIPPNTIIEKESLLKLFGVKNVIITGDMNGHSKLWGGSKTNHIGRLIEDIIDETNFVVLNTREPTRQNYDGGMSSLDLSLCSQNLASKSTWAVLDDMLGSDHLPTITIIDEVVRNNENIKETFNLKKADWSLYRQKCVELFQDIKQSDDTELYEFEIRNAILTAANKSVPVSNRRSTKIKSVPYWDEQCTDAINKRNKARIRANKTRLLSDCIEYRRLKGHAQLILRKKERSLE
jgi:exonuclease III